MIEVKEIHSEVMFMESCDIPITFEGMQFPQKSIEAKREYFDFILRISDMAFHLNSTRIGMMEMIRCSLPPRYRDAELEIKKLSDDYLDFSMKVGVRIVGFKSTERYEHKFIKNTYIPENCHGCGSPMIINGKCKYCGREYGPTQIGPINNCLGPRPPR